MTPEPRGAWGERYDPAVEDTDPTDPASELYPCLTSGCANLADEGHGTCADCRAEVARRLGDIRPITEPRGAWGERFEYEGERYDPAEAAYARDLAAAPDPFAEAEAALLRDEAEAERAEDDGWG